METWVDLDSSDGINSLRDRQENGVVQGAWMWIQVDTCRIVRYIYGCTEDGTECRFSQVGKYAQRSRSREQALFQVIKEHMTSKIVSEMENR